MLMNLQKEFFFLKREMQLSDQIKYNEAEDIELFKNLSQENAKYM